MAAKGPDGIEKDSEKDDAFKREFKRFKKFREEEMERVIDFNTPNNHSEIYKESSELMSDYTQEQAHSLGLKLPRKWNIFKLKTVPGLIVITNPFLSGHQHYWIYHCLYTYPCLPNICNLDSHFTRSDNGQIWPTKEECLLGKTKMDKDSLLYRLRWVTLGYHYNWTTKLYHKDNYTPFPSDLSNLTQFILKVIGFSTFVSEAAIVNYYHLDSTLSGHTDHSEYDLSAPLISISFGQSAIFLVGGPTKQVTPLPLLIRSGDVVIMSGESRLAYHGVPKILTTPDYPIPECVGRDCLWAELTANDSSCFFCKRAETRKHGMKRVRDDYFDNEENKNGYPKKKRKPEQCNAENDQSTESEPELCQSESEDTRDRCSNCEWIKDNWEHFETYLSYSRININVRQVGNIT